jgi:hypothetical protein
MNESARFQDIQDEFSKRYPYLKMNFYKFNGEKIAAEERMTAFYRTFEKNDVEIPPDKRLGRLIVELENVLLVKVRMMRKSGTLWIETSLTTDWTLEQQNREGKYLS